MRSGAVCKPDAQKRTVWADAGIVQPLLEPLPAKVKVILVPVAIGTAANASNQRTSAYAAAVRVRMPRPA
jgi:hypothetical protein